MSFASARPRKPRRTASQIGPYAGLGLADVASYHLLGAHFGPRRPEVALTRHQAAGIIGCDPKTAATRLNRLVKAGFGERVTLGSRGRGLAGQWRLELRLELVPKKGNLPFSREIQKTTNTSARSSRQTLPSALTPAWQTVLEAIRKFGQVNRGTGERLIRGELTPEEAMQTIERAGPEAVLQERPVAWLLAVLTTGDRGARFRTPPEPSREEPSLAGVIPLHDAGASRRKLGQVLPELHRAYGPALFEAIQSALSISGHRPNVRSRGGLALHLLLHERHKVLNATRRSHELTRQGSSAPGRHLDRAAPHHRPDPVVGAGAELWGGIRAALAERLTPDAFEYWIAPVVPNRYAEDTLEVSVPTRSHRDWLDNQLFEDLSAACAAVGRPDLSLVVRAEG